MHPKITIKKKKMAAEETPKFLSQNLHWNEAYWQKLNESIARYNANGLTECTLKRGFFSLWKRFRNRTDMKINISVEHICSNYNKKDVLTIFLDAP